MIEKDSWTWLSDGIMNRKTSETGFSVDEECQEIRDNVHENDDINWNFEVYRHYLTEEQRKVKFHHLMHSLFVDGHVYSFEDVVRMSEEDFKVCLEINWSGD